MRNDITTQTSLTSILLCISGAYELQTRESFNSKSISTIPKPSETLRLSHITLMSALYNQDYDDGDNNSKNKNNDNK